MVIVIDGDHFYSIFLQIEICDLNRYEKDLIKQNLMIFLLHILKFQVDFQL